MDAKRIPYLFTSDVNTENIVSAKYSHTRSSEPTNGKTIS